MLMVWNATTRQLTAIDGREEAPAAFTEDAFCVPGSNCTQTFPFMPDRVTGGALSHGHAEMVCFPCYHWVYGCTPPEGTRRIPICCSSEKWLTTASSCVQRVCVLAFCGAWAGQHGLLLPCAASVMLVCVCVVRSHCAGHPVGVPGTVAALALAHRMFGSTPLANLSAAAIDIATTGARTHSFCFRESASAPSRFTVHVIASRMITPSFIGPYALSFPAAKLSACVLRQGSRCTTSCLSRLA